MKRLIKGLGWILLLIVCSGCGKSKFEISKDYNMYKKEIQEVNASEEDVASMHFIAMNSEWMIYTEEVKKDGVNNELERNYYKYCFDTAEITSLPINKYFNKNEDVFACVSCQNHFILWENDAVIYLFDNTWEMEEQVNVADLLIQKNPELSSWNKMYIYHVWADDEYIFVALNGALCVLNYDLQLVSTMESKNTDYNIIPGSNGRVYIIEDYKNTLYSYNKKKNVFEKKKTFSDEEAEEEIEPADFFMGNDNYDWFYYNYYPFGEKSDSYSNFIGVKNGKYYKVFDFEQMGITQNNIVGEWGKGIANDGQGGFWLVCYSGDRRQLTVSHLIKDSQIQNYSLKNGKTIIRIGGLTFPTMMQFLVMDYNADSQQYYIEVVNYLEKYSDYEDAMNHLNIDIMKGDVLDGYSMYDLDYMGLIQKGVLQNLNEYFQNSIHSEDEFDPYYMKLLKDSDGNIFFVYPNYIVAGYAYTDRINFDDLTEYEQLMDKNIYFWGGTEEDLLVNLLRYSGTRYVDVEQKELHLENQDFRSLLQIIKKQKEMHVTGENPNVMIKNGNAYSVNAQILYPTWYIYYEQLFGEKLILTVPGNEGPIIDPMTFILGVDSRSDKKDAIYNFLDYIYTPEVYYKYFYYDGFPALNIIWDCWKTDLLAKTPCVNQLGNMVRPRVFSMGAGDAMLEIEPGMITEQDYIRIRQEIEKAVWINPLPDKYITIILEEADAYFEGKQSLEETCHILENRLNNAMAE